MTVPSLYESQGLCVVYGDPLVKSPRSGYLGELRQALVGYEHEIATMGGFLRARLTLAGDLMDVNDWLERGLDRHVEVYNPDLDVVWEGFVNLVSASAGTITATCGPLTDVGNRVSVVYSPRDDTVYPAVSSPRTVTAIAQDTDSQAIWGVWEKVLTGGTCTIADAEQARDTYLAENAEPKPSESFNLGTGAPVSMTIDCLGYQAWLDAYVYENTTPGSQSIYNKLLAVLAYDPNGIFSVDYSDVTANPYLTTAQDANNNPAWTVCRNLLALGDANDNRYTFGFYAGQRAKYANAASLPTRYEHRITDKAQRVEPFGTGGSVRLSDVVAGEWLYVPDFYVGRSEGADRRKDPRYIFVESVRFTAPNGLAINGTGLENLPQLLAKQQGTGAM